MSVGGCGSRRTQWMGSSRSYHVSSTVLNDLSPCASTVLTMCPSHHVSSAVLSDVALSLYMHVSLSARYIVNSRHSCGHKEFTVMLRDLLMYDNNIELKTE